MLIILEQVEWGTAGVQTQLDLTLNQQRHHSSAYIFLWKFLLE